MIASAGVFLSSEYAGWPLEGASREQRLAKAMRRTRCAMATTRIGRSLAQHIERLRVVVELPEEVRIRPSQGPVVGAETPRRGEQPRRSALRDLIAETETLGSATAEAAKKQVKSSRHELRFRDARDEPGLPPTPERLRQRSEPTLRAKSGHAL